MIKIKNLNKGDTFLDSLGIPLKIISITPLPWLGIPKTSPKVKVRFMSGNREIFMNFRASRLVQRMDT